ncbi:MAG: TolC family protein, partial [Candidatus Latescibacterota bacterium]
RAARLALAAAGAGISQALGASMPALSLVAQRQRSNVGYDNVPIRRTDTSYIGLNLSVPLFSGGSDVAALREARSSQALAEHEVRLAELDASQRVREAYLRLRHAESRIEAGRAVVESSTLTTAAMQQAFALGTATTVEVLEAIHDGFQAERALQGGRYDGIRQFLVLRHEAGVLNGEDLALVSSWFEEPRP